jgi:hypothetical protein
VVRGRGTVIGWSLPGSRLSLTFAGRFIVRHQLSVSCSSSAPSRAGIYGLSQ